MGRKDAPAACGPVAACSAVVRSSALSHTDIAICPGRMADVLSQIVGDGSDGSGDDSDVAVTTKTPHIEVSGAAFEKIAGVSGLIGTFAVIAILTYAAFNIQVRAVLLLLHLIRFVFCF